MTLVRVPMTECDGCGKLKSAGERGWKTRWYGGTSVVMDFCRNCVRAGLDRRLSQGNPYDTSADAHRAIDTLRNRRVEKLKRSSRT